MVEEYEVPKDLEAERILISTCAAPGASGAGSRVDDLVLGTDPGVFVGRAHGLVWTALQALVARHEEPSYLLLAAQLETYGKLEEAGGRSGLFDLLSGEEVSKPEALVKILRELRGRRELMKAGADLMRKAADRAMPIMEVQSAFQARLGVIDDQVGRKSGTPAPLRLLDPGAWGDEEPPPTRYLLEGLLPLGVPAILAAMSNAGKSLLGMMISFAVATGWALFGCKGPTQPMKVLFVELEDDEDEIKRRFRRCRDLFQEDQTWGEAQNALLDANWRALTPEWGSPTSKSLTALLPYLQAHAEQLCRGDGHVGLVVLDTFAALAEGEENKAEVQRAWWHACFSLAASTGATPLIIHHVRKPPSGAKGKGGLSMSDRLSFDVLRGSSAIVAGARAILQAEPLTPDEAARLNLYEERAAAGNYLILALTKTISGPKGAWLALEQRQAWENGAGFFVPMAGGDRVCAALRGKGAAAKLTLAEAVLLSIADGCEDRQELASRHWPAESQDKAKASFKTMLSHLRTRHGWLQKGPGFLLTVLGHNKAQELRSLRGDFRGDFASSGRDEALETNDVIKVSSGDLAGDLLPTGTDTGNPAVAKRRLVPQGTGQKVSKSPNPRRRGPGDLATSEEER